MKILTHLIYIIFIISKLKGKNPETPRTNSSTLATLHFNNYFVPNSNLLSFSIMFACSLVGEGFSVTM